MGELFYNKLISSNISFSILTNLLESYGKVEKLSEMDELRIEGATIFIGIVGKRLDKKDKEGKNEKLIENQKKFE